MPLFLNILHMYLICICVWVPLRHIIYIFKVCLHMHSMYFYVFVNFTVTFRYFLVYLHNYTPHSYRQMPGYLYSFFCIYLMLLLTLSVATLLFCCDYDVNAGPGPGHDQSKMGQAGPSGLLACRRSTGQQNRPARPCAPAGLGNAEPIPH